jgi:hypothetical protein
VDTWSIDQADGLDKHRQIPLMSGTYRQAQMVAVILKQSISFSQADWDLAMFNLREARQYLENDDLYNTPKSRACYSSPTVSENLVRSVSMIDELTRTPWFGRVWTAQE